MESPRRILLALVTCYLEMVMLDMRGPTTPTLTPCWDSGDPWLVIEFCITNSYLEEVSGLPRDGCGHRARGEAVGCGVPTEGV